MACELKDILVELRRARGIDLSRYRQAMLERRFEGRMAKLGIRSPEEYLRRLDADPDEFDALLQVFSINVSSFFRDSMVWEVLDRTVLPEIIERQRKTRAHEIRIWSAGCAGGEEPYSLAILFHQALKNELDAWRIHIFATDLSESSLKSAAHGVYSRDKLENTKLGIVDEYFTPAGSGFEVQPMIRRMVWFSREDLTSTDRVAPVNSVYGTFDLVLCRNVLIYFNRDLQHQVIDKLARSLGHDGWLVLGSAETLGEQPSWRFVAHDRGCPIYRKR